MRPWGDVLILTRNTPEQLDQQFSAQLPLVLGLLLGITTSGPCADPEPADLAREARTLLSRHCLKCHGRDAEHRQANLRLDLRESATRKLKSGQRAVVPGHPAQSEIFQRVTSHDPDLRMPPPDAGPPLTSQHVSLLRRWILGGAVFSRHWSFVPPRSHVPPAAHAGWTSRNAVDHFVHARLHSAGLTPSVTADRFTLIRRLSLDLRGLPATPKEVAHFADDHAPGAWTRLVDRLLADPAFGERWARVWLDLARYADSRGYGSDPLRPNAWRFRDWVIDSLNANQPYDRFTTDQLAGDLLPNASLEQKMATAFHRNTMTNTEGGTDDEEFRVAAVKDRVDTTLQVWMGLTMGCAKCHDHKYDPISQKDYYRFYAIFNQTADADRSDDSPVLEAPTALMRAQVVELDKQITALTARRKQLEPRIAAEKSGAASSAITGHYLRLELPGKKRILSLAEVQVLSGTKNHALKAKVRQSSTAFGGPAGLAVDGNTNGHYTQAKSTTHTAEEENPWWEVDLGSDVSVERIIVFHRTDAKLFTRQAGLVLRLLDKDRKTVWEDLLKDAPAAKHTFATLVPGPAAIESQKLADRLAALKKQRPKFPTLPILQELPPEKHRQTFMMVRGSFLQRGERVTAGFPAGFHQVPDHVAPTRLGVAHWITSAKNPLTARVAVNRVWSRLFGTGLVSTEEDFGTQGAPPSHPRLLDWLATEFMRTDWDVKRLLRLVVTSATYRQSSRVSPHQLQIDPTNRLLARGPRFRLSAETVRDQALALSGLLDQTLGGPSVYPYQPPGLWQAAFNGQRKWPNSPGFQKYRRGLYTFWRRTVPYPSMAAFDAPSREICTVRRIRTNTPLQAFVTLNDPAFVEAAQALGRRLVAEGGPTLESRLRFGLSLATGRPATDRQLIPLKQLYKSELAHFGTQLEAAQKVATDPLGPVPADADMATLAAWTVVASVLLNLDAVLTKG